MKRFSEGPGRIGIALLVLLLACALFGWFSGIGAFPEGETRSMAMDGSLSVTAGLALEERPRIQQGRSQMTDDSSEIDGTDEQNSGIENAPMAQSDRKALEDSSDLLPRIITLVVILSVVLVVLALLPKKNKTH